MARLSLKCACSWTFFIPDTTQGYEVTCPNCQNGVPIPGRKPGEAIRSAGMVAAEKAKAATLVRLGVGLGIAIVVVSIVLFFVLSSGGGKSGGESDRDEDRPVHRSPVPLSGTSGSNPTRNPAVNPSDSRTSGSDVKPPAPKPVDVERISALKRTVLESQWQINISGIVVEALRLGGASGEAERISKLMTELNTKITTSVADLGTLDAKADVQAYLLPGDRVLVLGQKDLTALRPAEAAAYVNSWLQRLRANTLEQVVILRDARERQTLFLHFPEETKELLQLARIPAGAAPDGPPSTTPVIAGTTNPQPSYVPIVDISPALAQDIRTRLKAVPQTYLTLIPADETKRMEALLKEMKGSPEDVAFLSNRIAGDWIARFEQEGTFFRSKVQELEPKTKETTSVDTVFFKDGRKVEGKVEEETEEFVKIKSRFGSVKVPRADIARVEKGKGAGVQFPDKLKAAQGKVPELTALVAWCKENNLRLEKDYVAYVILTLDPLNEGARKEVGLAKTPGLPKK
jgi:hypothetical protein